MNGMIKYPCNDINEFCCFWWKYSSSFNRMIIFHLLLSKTLSIFQLFLLCFCIPVCNICFCFRFLFKKDKFSIYIFLSILLIILYNRIIVCQGIWATELNWIALLLNFLLISLNAVKTANVHWLKLKNLLFEWQNSVETNLK